MAKRQRRGCFIPYDRVVSVHTVVQSKLTELYNMGTTGFHPEYQYWLGCLQSFDVFFKEFFDEAVASQGSQQEKVLSLFSPPRETEQSR